MLYCVNHQTAIEDLPLSKLKEFSPLFDEDVYEKIDIRACISAKKSMGSTSFESVAAMIRKAKKELE